MAGVVVERRFCGADFSRGYEYRDFSSRDRSLGCLVRRRPLSVERGTTITTVELFR
jgi:hypothetical protein